jgi:hypothetical protein
MGLFSLSMGDMNEIVEGGGIVRLRCRYCTRDDFAFITVEQLQAAVAAGWESVEEVQSFAESIDTGNGDHMLDWETHLGRCSDCIREEAEPDGLGRLIRDLS